MGEMYIKYVCYMKAGNLQVCITFGTFLHTDHSMISIVTPLTRCVLQTVPIIIRKKEKLMVGLTQWIFSRQSYLFELHRVPRPSKVGHKGLSGTLLQSNVKLLKACCQGEAKQLTQVTRLFKKKMTCSCRK